MWRNRLIARPGFRRFALSFPLLKGVARARARGLFDLVAGFVYSQTLAGFVALDLPQRLAGGPKTLAMLADETGIPAARLAVLMDAAASLHLAQRFDSGGYGLGAQGAALLGMPGLLPMIRHHALFYRDLADPVALLTAPPGATELSRFWAYAGATAPETADSDKVQAYSALMAASQAMIADDVLGAYSLRPHRVMLELGAGEGVFAAAALRSAPHLRAQLFDLPAVVARAQLRLASLGLGGRAEFHGGDFFRSGLPQGADLVALVRVVHDHDDGPVEALLRRVRAILPPHGKLLIAEPMSGAPGAGPMADAYFGFYLRAMGSGRPRRPEDLGRMVRAAGFRRSALARTPLPLVVQVLVAEV